MKRITIAMDKKTGDWWATFHGPEAARIAQVCGSTRILTPYRWPHDAAEVVLYELKKRNPGYTVEVEPETTQEGK
jgi:hypothetical protein